MTHVVCVGDLLVDIHAALRAPLSLGSDTPAHVELRQGGAAANVAAWVVAGGGAATFVGRVGADALGGDAVAELAGAGVRAEIITDPDLPTGTCIVLVEADGERTMIPSAGANEAPLDVAALPERADWLYVSGYALLRDASRASVLQAMSVAREWQWSVAVDAASEGPLAAFGGRQFLDLVGDDVTLFANADEARVLTDAGGPAAMAQTLAVRCGRAVVKSGAAGAAWSDGAASEAVPAQATDVLDTTGAGDAFAAGFLVGGPAVTDRLAFATEQAARAVQVMGARPSRRSGRSCS